MGLGLGLGIGAHSHNWKCIARPSKSSNRTPYMVEFGSLIAPGTLVSLFSVLLLLLCPNLPNLPIRDSSLDLYKLSTFLPSG